MLSLLVFLKNMHEELYQPGLCCECTLKLKLDGLCKQHREKDPSIQFKEMLRSGCLLFTAIVIHKYVYCGDYSMMYFLSAMLTKYPVLCHWGI
jgi:uncharacterized protein YehS (DUF1456 family)